MGDLGHVTHQFLVGLRDHREEQVLLVAVVVVDRALGHPGLLPRTLAGRLSDRIGPRPVVLAGIALAAAGTAPFALAGQHTSEVLLSAALVVRGAGLGTATIAVMAGAFQGLRPGEIPHASSVTRILQQVGGTFGAAVLAVILQAQLAAHATAGAAAAFSRTFGWALGFTAVALIPAMLLPAGERPGRERPGRRRAGKGRPGGLPAKGPAGAGRGKAGRAACRRKAR
ncbi:MAG: MFS transporter, partial [Streptosporangiaceae bacterium]